MKTQQTKEAWSQFHTEQLQYVFEMLDSMLQSVTYTYSTYNVFSSFLSAVYRLELTSTYWLSCLFNRRTWLQVKSKVISWSWMLIIVEAILLVLGLNRRFVQLLFSLRASPLAGIWEVHCTAPSCMGTAVNTLRCNNSSMLGSCWRMSVPAREL